MEFRREAQTEEEQKRADDCIDRIEPMLEPLDCKTVGSVVMSLAACWLSGFPEREVRRAMALSMSLALFETADKKDEAMTEE